MTGLENIEEDSEEAEISVKVVLDSKHNPEGIWQTGQTLSFDGISGHNMMEDPHLELELPHCQGEGESEEGLFACCKVEFTGCPS